MRASCEALGSQTLFGVLGRNLYARVHVDASTAKAICEGKGLDRICYLDVDNLWLREQHVCVRERAPIVKINGKHSIADLMATNLPFNEIELHLTRLGLGFRAGRFEMVAKLYPGGEHAAVDDVADGFAEHGGVHCNDDKVNDGWDRWPSRDNGNVWTREHRSLRSTWCSPMWVAAWSWKSLRGKLGNADDRGHNRLRQEVLPTLLPGEW